MTKYTKPEAGKNVLLEGRVIRISVKENKWGELKRMMLVKGKGWQAWGSIPGVVLPEIGDEVEFKAALKWAKSNPNFGHYYRPREFYIKEEEV